MTTLCNWCDIREICITRKNINEIKHAEVEIKSCIFCKRDGKPFVPNTCTPYDPYPEDKIDIEEIKLERSTRDLSVDFSKMSQEIRKIKLEAVDGETMNCPECETINFADEMLTCKVCGFKCCSSCAFVTFDLDGGIDSVMCQKCDECFEEENKDE